MKANKVFAIDAFRKQIGTNPAELIFMASAGSPRGTSILRRGLSSENLAIQWISAKGLATVHDKASIPTIIDTAAKAPSEIKEQIAQSLLFFGDPIAQAAAERMISNKELPSVLEKDI